MWKDYLGIEVGLVNQEWKVYLERQHSGDYEVSRAGWGGDYMDPSTFLNMWMTGDGNNETGWSNEEYDGLLNQAARMSDAEARLEVLRKAEEIFLSEVPAIPIYWYSTNRAVVPYLQGWYHKALDNHPYKGLRFDDALLQQYEQVWAGEEEES